MNKKFGFSTLIPNILTTVVFLLTHGNLSAQINWPQFRGIEARGISSEANLPSKWSATENIAWKFDIPGRGWSSPIVWGDHIFLTSVINSGTTEDPKKGLYFGGERPKPPTSIHQYKVYCLNLYTGKTIWERLAYEGIPETPIHIKSSYASETPVTDGERVYCLFGNLGVFCYDFQGNCIWKLKLKPEKTRFGWGTAASPVLHKGRLYIVNDNESDSYILALDSKTGKELFRVSRDEKSNWATPYIWQNRLRTEIVTAGSGKVRSYNLEGRLLWTLEKMSSITIATPYENNGLLYISSGYILDRSKPIYAIRPGAEGNISLKKGETSNSFIAWSQPNSGPYNPTSIIYKNLLYVLYDRGLVACFNPTDGKEIYTPQRIPNGGSFTSSPWAYDDKIFFLNEDGTTFALKAGKDFQILHSNTLAADDMGMASPAIAGDRLLVRTAARIYCIRNKDPK